MNGHKTGNRDLEVGQDRECLIPLLLSIHSFIHAFTHSTVLITRGDTCEHSLPSSIFLSSGNTSFNNDNNAGL